jgi:hypothetical protein
VLYSARHTFGTVLYQRTGNLKLVMDLIGHTNTDTAMKYQRPAMELGRVVYRRPQCGDRPMTLHKIPTMQKECDPQVAMLLILEPTIGVEPMTCRLRIGRRIPDCSLITKALTKENGQRGGHLKC